MSIYYDLIKKPDVRQTGEPQSLYARAVPKGTIDKKEFIDRVHRFTGISRSVLEGSMTAFMDELRDCLVGGWTVELGELGYFSPSLNCRPVMEKKEVRAASVSLRGLNFRVSREFYRTLNEKAGFERYPKSSVSTPQSVSREHCLELLKAHFLTAPCISRAQYSRMAGRSYKQAVVDLNTFVAEGVLMRYGAGRNVVYAKALPKP